MTKDEIIEMLKKCGWEKSALDMMLDFAELIAEREREECAKLCDYVYDNIVTDEHIKDMAFKIRARGQE